MTKTKAQLIMAATEVRAADDVTAAIQDIAAEFEPYIIKQRRHFHKHPELSLAEERTTSDIANQLDAMNIPYERPLKTGLVATLRGTAPDAYREDGTPRRHKARAEFFVAGQLDVARHAAASCCAPISTPCPSPSRPARSSPASTRAACTPAATTAISP